MKLNFMMRRIIFSLYLIISSVSAVNARGIDLESIMVSEGEMNDGDVIATGQVFCEENNISKVSLLNIYMGDHVYSNVYTLQGKNKEENKLMVRIEGDGWHSSDKAGNGIYKKQKNKSEQFYVVINGHQNVKSDIYSIKASSICLYSYQE